MRPKKILLCVDDDEAQLSVLSFMFVTHGYRVLAAHSGQEAIALFRENMVDMVLTDYAMPKMSGDELVIKLKGIASHVPMVILGDLKKLNCTTQAADALISKRTCSSQELLERVRVMSARKRGPRKGIAKLFPAVAAHAV